MKSSILFLLVLILPETGLAEGDALEQAWVGLSVEQAVRRAADDRVVFNSEQRLDQLFLRHEPDLESTESTLRSLLAPFGLAIQPGPSGRWIVVRGTEPGVGWVTMSGQVSDAFTGKPLDAVRVSVYPGRRAVFSNAAGGFTAQVAPAGPYTIIVSADGYTTWRSDLEHSDVPPAIALRPAQTELNPITISASHYALLQEGPHRSTTMSRADVERVPHIADDVLRAVRWLPGMAHNDYSAQLQVRGGTGRETQVVFDGLRLHEPYHLKDLLTIFSVVDSNTIDAVDLYTGPQPARYGNATSAILDIQSRTPGTDWPRRVGISFLNGYAQASDSADDASWLASVRTGYLDVILDIIDDESGLDPVYTDVFARYDRTLNPDLEASIRFLGAWDRSEANDRDENSDRVDGDFRDLYAWIDLEGYLSANWDWQTSVFWGELQRERIGLLFELNEAGGLFEDRTLTFGGLRHQVAWSPSRGNHEWTAGIEWQRQYLDQVYESELIVRHPVIGDADVSRMVDLDFDHNVGVAYAAVQSHWSDALYTEFGIRGEYRDYLESEVRVSPRFSLVAPIGSSRLRFGVSRQYQAQELYELDVQDGITTFDPAQRVDHVVAAFEKRTPGGIELRSELYYKRYKDPIPYTELLFDNTQYLPELQAERLRIDADEARAFGIELSARQQRPTGVNWWASYTRSRAEERAQGIWTPRSWDQRDAISAGVSIPAGQWTWTLGWRYHSGWRTTPVIGVPAGDSQDFQIGTRNSDRLAPYHRMDLRVSRSWSFTHGSLQAYLEVLNVYNRRNECCQGVFGFFDTGGNERIFTETDEWLPFTPSLGVKWEW